jgi:predicted phage tail protein
MRKIFTKKWLKAAVVRAIKTMAQTAIATIGSTALITEINWILVGSSVALAGVASMLTSVAGLPEITEEVKGESEVES